MILQLLRQFLNNLDRCSASFCFGLSLRFPCPLPKRISSRILSKSMFIPQNHPKSQQRVRTCAVKEKPVFRASLALSMLEIELYQISHFQWQSEIWVRDYYDTVLDLGINFFSFFHFLYQKSFLFLFFLYSMVFQAFHCQCGRDLEDSSDLQIGVRGRLRVRVSSSEHAHFESFRPSNLKRVLSTENSYS